ncbi:MAG TPA: long-chain fatty acid--CoA ligase [Candidatus Acidoferrales bacterium]|nr:long-chain fatty acid--CoA ligase [Candidatus Acidoferrales bacterium]
MVVVSLALRGFRGAQPMRGTMMSYPLTLFSILERGGKYFPGVEIVSRRPDRSLHRTNFGEVYRRSRALAAGLVRAGLRRGDRVATLCWNHREHVEAYFGVPAAGGVVHTLNLRLSADELTLIARHAGDRFLIVDDVLLPVYEKFRASAPFERVWVVPTSGEPLPAGWESSETLVAGGDQGFRYPEVDENDAAAMCYTSGTTGQPKGVVYSHRALVLHSLVISVADGFGIRQSDTSLVIVPMFHANCWGLPQAAAMIGTKMILPGPFLDPVSLLDLIDSERATYAAGIPTIWMGIAEQLENNPQRWKIPAGFRATSGGAATPEGLLRRCDRLGIELRSSWGMTEMTPAGTTAFVKSTLDDLPEAERVRVRSLAGIPFPLVEARVVTPQGEAPWDGETTGELQVRGPFVAASYYNLPEAGDRWTEDGWFRTGDVAATDSEGYVRIADRTKDVIKSGGEWISSVALENALMGHAGVKEAAVIGVPHPKWLERPLAVVVKAAVCPDDETLRRELMDLLAGKFAKWQLPDAIVYVEAIPRTSVGKFQKTRLREQYKDWRWE